MSFPIVHDTASRSRRTDALVVLAAAAWLLAFAGLRPLVLPDEGRYAGVAWEMVTSGQWLVPTMDGLPYFHKPPLYYWITAAAMAVLGPIPIAARLAPWLGALLAVASLQRFVGRHAGEAAGRWSAGIVATMPLFFLAAQFANMDMLVAGCITAATTALADAALGEPEAPREERGPRRSLRFAYVAMALGVLAKGLIGIALPALVMLVWLGSSRCWRALASLLWWPGIAIFVALVVPWFAAVERQHPGFLDYFFLEHHVRRYAAGGFNNLRPPWFYPALVAATSVPALLAPRWTRALVRAGSPIDGLLLAWFGVVTLFFSVPASKPIGYILPALPPLAAWIALRAAAGGRRTRAAVTAAWMLCLVVEGWALWVSPARSTQDLATPLALLRRGDEPVVMVDTYPFDLPLLSRSAMRPIVVADWDEVARTRRDDWRHELHDAAGFADEADARRLLARRDLDPWLCGAGISWVIAPWPVAGRAAAFAGPPLAQTHDLALWRIAPGGAGGRAACEAALQ